LPRGSKDKDTAARKFLTRPCSLCPFRNDIRPYLTPARVAEIKRSVINGQQDFLCHSTVDYDREDEDDDEPRAQREGEKRCAGMTILCEKLSRPTQMMRIDERIGFYDARKMQMDAPVFDTFDEMIAAQRPRGVMKNGRRKTAR
jgi:hypothetical protein